MIFVPSTLTLINGKSLIALTTASMNTGVKVIFSPSLFSKKLFLDDKNIDFNYSNIVKLLATNETFLVKTLISRTNIKISNNIYNDIFKLYIDELSKAFHETNKYYKKSMDFKGVKPFPDAKMVWKISNIYFIVKYI